jgi:MFS transporter, DHA3 family, macrolide efflux protein
VIGSGMNDPAARRVALARFVSRAGGEAAFFVGIWGKAAFEFGASPGEQALMMASLGLSSLVGSALAGVLVDRFDPRRVLMGAEVVVVPSTLALMWPTTMEQMTWTVAVFGLATAGVMTAVASLPPFLTDDPARLHRINALVEGAASAAFIAGPGLGAVIVRYLGLDWIFVLDAVTSVIAVAIVVGLSIRKVPHKERTSALRELREGFRFVYRSRPLRLYVAIGTAVWLSFGSFGALEPLFYRDVLRTGPEALGWVNSLFGIGVVSGSIILNRVPARFVGARIALLGAFASGVGAIIYTSTSELPVVVVGAIYWGVVLGAWFPLLRTLLQLDTPDGLVGRIMGVNQAHNQVGELLPLTFAPALAASFGVQPVLVASGMCLMALAVLGLPEAVAVDRRRAPTPVVPAVEERIEEPVSPNP